MIWILSKNKVLSCLVHHGRLADCRVASERQKRCILPLFSPKSEGKKLLSRQVASCMTARRCYLLLPLLRKNLAFGVLPLEPAYPISKTSHQKLVFNGYSYRKQSIGVEVGRWLRDARSLPCIDITRPRWNSSKARKRKHAHIVLECVLLVFSRGKQLNVGVNCYLHVQCTHPMGNRSMYSLWSEKDPTSPKTVLMKKMMSPVMEHRRNRTKRQVVLKISLISLIFCWSGKDI